MDKHELFEQWKAAFDAHDWERESELWQAMGHLPVTPEIRALAVTLHNTPAEDMPAIRQIAKALRSALFVAPNFDTRATEAIVEALHSVVVQ